MERTGPLGADFDDPNAHIPMWFVNLQRRIKHISDKTVVWTKTRWASLAVLMAMYVVRVYYLAGFYIISYALGIYLLNLFIGFLSPQIDPETEGPMLPTVDDDGEYRPFVRRLPEFQFWMSSIRAVVLSICATFFSSLDLPVFWPVLLMYFILLFFLTMKQQIMHMLKHKYVPINFGKQTYGEMTKLKAGKNSK